MVARVRLDTSCVVFQSHPPSVVAVFSICLIIQKLSAKCALINNITDSKKEIKKHVQDHKKMAGGESWVEKIR